MACAEVASVNAKARAINLIIVSSNQGDTTKPAQLSCARGGNVGLKPTDLPIVYKVVRDLDMDQSTFVPRNPSSISPGRSKISGRIRAVPRLGLDASLI
jgi:hypothetical protein